MLLKNLIMKKKNNIRFGLMQGRLFPQKKKYNYFPSLWKKEFNYISKVGLDYIELIYNNKNIKDNPLHNKNDYKKKYKSCVQRKQIYSLNLDYFTTRNIFKENKKKLKLLNFIFLLCSNLKIKILVIPCIEKNLLNEKKLLIFSEQIKKILNYNFKVSLEINFNLKKTSQVKLGKQIGICMDVGNLSEKKINLKKFYNDHKNIINHIHIKDKKKEGEKYSNCMLGDGIVDFDTFFQTVDLKQHNHLTLETFYGLDPINNLKLNLDFLRKYV